VLRCGGDTHRFSSLPRRARNLLLRFAALILTLQLDEQQGAYMRSLCDLHRTRRAVIRSECTTMRRRVRPPPPRRAAVHRMAPLSGVSRQLCCMENSCGFDDSMLLRVDYDGKI